MSGRRTVLTLQPIIGQPVQRAQWSGPGTAWPLLTDASMCLEEAMMSVDIGEMSSRYNLTTPQWCFCRPAKALFTQFGGWSCVLTCSSDYLGLVFRTVFLQVACFDPAVDSWSLLSPLPAGHGEPGIAVLNSHIYILGGRSHDRGNRTKYVHVYNTDTDEWEDGIEFKERVSGLAACVALLPPAVIAQARSWEQRTKYLWEDMEMVNTEDSSEDWNTVPASTGWFSMLSTSICLVTTLSASDTKCHSEP